jgi:hypothetical protein
MARAISCTTQRESQADQQRSQTNETLPCVAFSLLQEIGDVALQTDSCARSQPDQIRHYDQVHVHVHELTPNISHHHRNCYHCRHMQVYMV